MSLIHAYEKLGHGLDILATDPGPIKARLVAAFLNALAEVPEDALPPEARERWHKVWNRVTAVPGGAGEGRLLASIRALDDKEATLIAGHIVTVYAIVQLATQVNGSHPASPFPHCIRMSMPSCGASQPRSGKIG
jgi:hypothetical protein